jgi:hypothetical protein
MPNVAVWSITNNLNKERFTDWLVEEKNIPRAKAEADVKEIQRIVNYLLAIAGIEKRF